jgi:hypothetical protein
MTYFVLTCSSTMMASKEPVGIRVIDTIRQPLAYNCSTVREPNGSGQVISDFQASLAKPLKYHWLKQAVPFIGSAKAEPLTIKKAAAIAVLYMDTLQNKNEPGRQRLERENLSSMERIL